MIESVNQRAMFRAAMDEIEERTRVRVDELADRVLPGSQRVALEIPASSVTNNIDTRPIAEAIKSALFAIEHQPIVTNTIDVSPIAEVLKGVLAVLGQQQAPQVSMDMSPIALAVGSGTRDVVDLIEAQNEKIAVLSNTLTKLLKVLSDQKPIQIQPHVTMESSSIAALVVEQREFFIKMLNILADSNKPRRIRIIHGDEESTVVEE